MQWAAFGNELAERTRDREHGLTVSNQQLANLWVSHNDARNYIVLGDPAVQAWVSPQ